MDEEKEFLLHRPLGDLQPKGFFHPTRAFYRYTMLFVISMVCFGNYFAYDEIEPLEKQINPDLRINHAKFGLMYSVYSIPNVILVFFGGILGDKIGLRMAGSIFSALVCIGAFLVALGPTLVQEHNGKHLLSPHEGYYIVLLGRTVFGIGAESLNVIQSSMVALWFTGGKELAMAMGCTLSISRLGDFLSLNLSAKMANWFGSYVKVLWFGGFLCLFSFVSTIVYSVLDKFAEKRIPNRKPPDPSENELNFRAILHFESRFWIISFLCMTYYGGVLPFVAVCNDFLQTKYHFSKVTAGYYVSVVILASMILGPFLGKLLDIVGRKTYFIILGSIAIIPAHLILSITNFHPLFSIIVIGLSFSLVPAALWPSIPLIVKEREIATAFGLMTSIQNIGLAAINYIAGLIADSGKNDTVGYNRAMLFFVAMDLLGLVFAIALIIADKAKDGLLTGSPSKKIEEEIIN